MDEQSMNCLGLVDELDLEDTRWKQTPLSWAAEYGHEAVVKLLLATGKVDVNSKSEDGLTPLSWATENGHKAVVKLLLATGKVDIESENDNSRTPLSLAAEYGHEAVVKLLLEDAGYTPLGFAVVAENDAIVKLLLEAKADPNSLDKDGDTPLSRAIDIGKGALVELLQATW